MSDWLVVAVVGAGTYLSRLSFVAVFGRIGVPPWLGRALKHVAPAVLAALVAPAVLLRDGAVDAGSGNPRLYAALVAAVVAWRLRSVAATIVVGMGLLWLLQAL
jgi:branched-subunit amino acid transport protein